MGLFFMIVPSLCQYPIAVPARIIKGGAIWPLQRTPFVLKLLMKSGLRPVLQAFIYSWRWENVSHLGPKDLRYD